MERRVGILLTAVFLTAAACTDFLTVEPVDELSRADLLGTVDGADAAVVGLYALLGDGDYYRERMPIYADVAPNLLPEGGAVDIADLNGKRLEYATIYGLDLTAAYDGAGPNGGADSGLDNLYAHAYTLLYQANDVLAALDSLTEGPPERLASLRGEALVVRALVHHDLVRLFAQAPGFSADGAHAGVALILSPPGVTDRPARATVAEVYAAIRDDLEVAESLLSSGLSRRSSAPLWIDQTVAQGLLARVAAYQGDWETCYAAADRCLGAADAPLLSRDDYLVAWTADEMTEAFWRLDLQRLAEFDATDELESTASVIGVGAEKPFASVSAGLLEAFTPADIRRQLFVADTVGRVLSLKWPSIAPAIRNPTLLRRSEVVLLRAEAAVELGRLDKALADLSEIALRADPDAELPPLSQDALRQNIRQERRRELALEGHHFFDLGRWGADLVRADCPAFVERCTLTYPDDRYVLPIPLDAIERNPNLTQNPGY